MTTAIQRETKIKTLQDMINGAMPTIKEIAPRHASPEKLLKLLLKTIRTTPRILDCEPRSVVHCFIGASELGLDLGGVTGEAYMVPFNDRKRGVVVATLIPGYRGLMKLARQSGKIDVIEPACVYEHEVYEYQLGLQPILKHIPAPTEDRGELIAAYAIARYLSGQTQFVWMWRKDIEKVRPSHAGTDSPWHTHFDEMVLKTPIRRLAKFLPASPELAKAIALDEAADRGDAQFIDLEPLAATDAPQSPTETVLTKVKQAANRGKAAEKPVSDPKASEGQPPQESEPEPAKAPPATDANAERDRQVTLMHDLQDVRVDIRDIYDKLPDDKTKVTVRNQLNFKNITELDGISDIGLLVRIRADITKLAEAPVKA